MKKIVVTFLESQNLCEYDGFLNNVELINSDKGIEMFGGDAYLVNEDWYNKVKAGKIPTKEFSTDELANDLVINYTYPIPGVDEIL